MTATEPSAAVAPPAAPSSGAAPAPGQQTSDALALAGCWLSAYESLAARVAHELNNALNGVAMNLEVVRLRARPGADAERAAPFAEAAAAEQDQVAALAGALVALGRTPRAGVVDVRPIARHACTLVAAVGRHDGITLELVDSDSALPTAAPAHAVRLAVVSLLLASSAMTKDADGLTHPSRALRCILRAGAAPTLTLDPPPPLLLDSDLIATLGRSGIDFDSRAARLTFPAA